MLAVFQDRYLNGSKNNEFGPCLNVDFIEMNLYCSIISNDVRIHRVLMLKLQAIDVVRPKNYPLV
jgi:hypothetical protein